LGRNRPPVDRERTVRRPATGDEPHYTPDRSTSARPTDVAVPRPRVSPASRVLRTSHHQRRRPSRRTTSVRESTRPALPCQPTNRATRVGPTRGSKTRPPRTGTRNLHQLSLDPLIEWVVDLRLRPGGPTGLGYC